MLVWKGNGILVPIITFVSALLTQMAFDKMVGPFYYTTHRWTIGVAMVPAAVLCWLLGKYFKKLNSQKAVDATGREVEVNGSEHSFFFIPMHYCGIVLLLIGAALCVAELF